MPTLLTFAPAIPHTPAAILTRPLSTAECHKHPAALTQPRCRGGLIVDEDTGDPRAFRQRDDMLRHRFEAGRTMRRIAGVGGRLVVAP